MSIQANTVSYVHGLVLKYKLNYPHIILRYCNTLFTFLTTKYASPPGDTLFYMQYQ